MAGPKAPQQQRTHAAGSDGRRRRVAVAALALLATAAAVAAHRLWWRPHILPPDPQAQALVEWALAHGASLPGAVVGRACPTCPRGVFASKNLKHGEQILTVPYSLALVISNRPAAAGTSLAEYARDLLVRMHTEPGFNATWGTYLTSLPRLEDMFGMELLTPTHVEMLHHPGLAAQAQGNLQFLEGVFNGTHNNGMYPPLPTVIPAVSLEAFKHTIALIRTRAFGAYQDGHVNITSPYMMPIIDLLNHSNEPNTQKVVHHGNFHMIASRPIAKGEEIYNFYNSELHRNDKALFFYGYVGAQERPLLCAADLPAGFDFRSKADSLHDDPSQGFMTQAEYDRLAAALAASPTTEAEDLALLKSGVFKDWRDQTILQFRILRKRALRLALEKLGLALRRGVAGSTAGQQQEL